MAKSNKQLDFEITNLRNQIKTLKNVATQRTFSEAFSAFVTHQGNRDTFEVFGYPDLITSTDYYQRYERQDIAKRIIEAYPEACWTKDIVVSDDLNSEDITSFEKDFTDLASRLKLYNYMYRLDKVTGFGRYGVLYIGVAGEEPKTPVEDTVDEKDILYITPYTEDQAQIASYNTDPQSPRYGLPETYNLSVNTFEGIEGQLSTEKSSMVAHHTRIIHVAEGLLGNDIFGQPRLKSIYNRLIDLDKVMGGSAELFWQNGRGALNLNMPSDVDLDSDSKDLLTDNMQQFSNNLTRYLKTKGIDVNAVEFQVPNPEQNVEQIFKMISGATGIPVRILTGSERGELASTQDTANWNNRVSERRVNFCEPSILRPFIDWCIQHKTISEPKDDIYYVEWPMFSGVSEEQKAEIAAKKASAITQYNNSPGIDQLVPPKQFVEEILELEFKGEENFGDMTEQDITE